MDWRSAEIFSSEKPEKGAEIVALQFLPGRGLPAFLLMPGGEVAQRVAVIALRIDRRAAIGRQVREEFLDVTVVDGWQPGFHQVRF